MDVAILTVTLGRELYVQQLVNSINKLTNWQNHNLIHYIVYQGEPSNLFLNFISEIPYKIILLKNNEKKKTIGSILEGFKIICSSEVIWKLDDDALLYGENIFDHIEAVREFHSKAVLSPFPVGLFGAIGGASPKGHITIYSKKYDRYYTLRKVNYINGFARIMPTDLFKQINFTDRHVEDQECVKWCKDNNIPMYVFENTLIVEHNETRLGQYLRYGENYLTKKLS